MEKQKTKAVVVAQFSVVGFHQWAGAPVAVKYLSDKHRHVFTFRVEANVQGHDREIEFHMLGRDAREKLYCNFTRDMNGEYQFDGRSCEMLADGLMYHLRAANWPVTAVECWEDMENGARVALA